MTTQVPNSMLQSPGGVGGITLPPLTLTALTINAANGGTYNGNVLPCSNASAQVVTIVAGAGLTGGMVLEQTGTGLVSFAPSGVTLNAPNGLSTSGARTTLTLVQESTDVYTVYSRPTSDPTNLLGTVGATVTLDIGKWNVFTLTLSANCTISVTGAVVGQACSAMVFITQDASHTVTFSPVPKTPAAAGYTMTTGAGKRDVVTVTTVDGGSTLDLYIGGQDMR